MFKYLDHPSEALVEVTAEDEASVFRDAALALFDLMTDTSRLKPELEFKIEATAPERHLLLIDWLNRLILLHEVENIFLCSFEIHIERDSDWKVIALARGERIMENHERRLHAKSATYGMLKWDEIPNGHRVQFVIDI